MQKATDKCFEQCSVLQNQKRSCECKNSTTLSITRGKSSSRSLNRMQRFGFTFHETVTLFLSHSSPQIGERSLSHESCNMRKFWELKIELWASLNSSVTTEAESCSGDNYRGHPSLAPAAKIRHKFARFSLARHSNLHPKIAKTLIDHLGRCLRRWVKQISRDDNCKSRWKNESCVKDCEVIITFVSTLKSF